MAPPSLIERYPSLPWVTPFLLFMLWLAAAPALGIPQPWESILRVTVLTAVLLTVSRPVLTTLRVQHAGASILLGLAVCALWVAPDQLVPGWRSHWLFQNSITGTVTTSIPPGELANPLVVALRIARAALIVPVVEELFWRGWLPRWLVNNDWQRVPLGRYTTLAFVGSALLFASEHGPYWEVGLACGLIYNWYMWKTKSLGDLILVHAVTNGALSAFVLVTGQYAYWM
jgi:CAAX prenyl protease-like protein